MNHKIKNYVGIAIIVGIVLVSVAGLIVAKAVARSAPVSNRTFTASGEGKAVAVPDVGQFTFSVRTEGGTNLTDLQEKNTEASNKVITFVKSKGVDAKDIRTVAYNVEPRQTFFPCTGNGPCQPPQVVGYTVRQTVEVKVRDFAKTGELLGGVVQQGANEVSQLQFTLDDPSKPQNEARAEAMEKARAAARETAKAGKFRMGRLVAVSEGGYPGPIPYDAYGRGAAELDATKTVPQVVQPTVEPGSQEVVATVVLTYEIR